MRTMREAWHVVAIHRPAGVRRDTVRPALWAAVLCAGLLVAGSFGTWRSFQLSAWEVLSNGSTPGTDMRGKATAIFGMAAFASCLPAIVRPSGSRWPAVYVTATFGLAAAVGLASWPNASGGTIVWSADGSARIAVHTTSTPAWGLYLVIGSALGGACCGVLLLLRGAIRLQPAHHSQVDPATEG